MVIIGLSLEVVQGLSQNLVTCSVTIVRNNDITLKIVLRERKMKEIKVRVVVKRVGELSVSSTNSVTTEVLVASFEMNCHELVLNSGCSFHIVPILMFFIFILK